MLSKKCLFVIHQKNILRSLQAQKILLPIQRNAAVQSCFFSMQKNNLTDEDIGLFNLAFKINNTVKSKSQKKEFLSKFRLPEESLEYIQAIAENSNSIEDIEMIERLKNCLDFKSYGILEEVFSGSSSVEKTFLEVKCSGCGAFFQCHDRLKSGFISEEQMTLPKHLLNERRCKRCSALLTYDLALKTAIKPKHFKKLIATQIKSNKDSVVIAMVDLTDFTTNTLSQLLDGTIRKNSQVILVGNKFDLLPPDSHDYDVKIKTILKDSSAFLNWRLKDVHLISAKTGFGVESLVSSVLHLWGSEHDVYLIGTVNAGKSTLFNLLLDSDLVKASAINTSQKATVSKWPGTTLNTLKFPLQFVDGGRLSARRCNIKEDYIKTEVSEPSGVYCAGSVKRNILSGLHHLNPFEIESPNTPHVPLSGKHRWFHDTPGIVSEESILPLLDRNELEIVTPTRPYIPRIFSLSPGQALTFGGIGRVEYFKGNNDIFLFVFSSDLIPIVIASIEETNEHFDSWLSSGKLKFPASLERHQQLGSFHVEEFLFYSDRKLQAVCDLIFPSTCWMTVVIPKADQCMSLKASCLYTPPVERLPLLDNVFKLKGKRLNGTPKYSARKDYDRLFKYGRNVYKRTKKPLSSFDEIFK